MGHTPYGYRIEDGRAVIDEEQAERVRKLYRGYLSGLALMPAAKQAGIETWHGSAKRLLQNRHYLGDAYYPAIIDRETFDKAEQELKKRQKSWEGYGNKRKKKKSPIRWIFPQSRWRSNMKIHLCRQNMPIA